MSESLSFKRERSKTPPPPHILTLLCLSSLSFPFLASSFPPVLFVCSCLLSHLLLFRELFLYCFYEDSGVDFSISVLFVGFGSLSAPPSVSRQWVLCLVSVFPFRGHARRGRGHIPPPITPFFNIFRWQTRNKLTRSSILFGICTGEGGEGGSYSSNHTFLHRYFLLVGAE